MWQLQAPLLFILLAIKVRWRWWRTKNFFKKVLKNSKIFFQLDIYISEMWTDPALDYSWMEPCKYNLSLNSILLEKLWTPGNF